MEHRLDELAKALAGGMSRREALRRVGGLMGAVLASLGLGRTAWSAPAPNCVQFCKDCGISPSNGVAFGQCVSSCAKCQGKGRTNFCDCPTAASPDVPCCHDDEACCPSRGVRYICCEPGLVCSGADACTQP